MSSTLIHTFSKERDSVTESRNWQARLIGLLSRFEHNRMEIAQRRISADAAWLLDKVEAMVLTADEFARETTFPSHVQGSESQAIARAGLFLTQLQCVRQGISGGGVVRSVLTALGVNSSQSVVPAIQFCMDSAAETLNKYFGLFTEKFPSSANARGWVDAASTFLIDFRKLAMTMSE